MKKIEIKAQTFYIPTIAELQKAISWARGVYARGNHAVVYICCTDGDIVCEEFTDASGRLVFDEPVYGVDVWREKTCRNCAAMTVSHYVAWLKRHFA